MVLKKAGEARNVLWLTRILWGPLKGNFKETVVLRRWELLEEILVLSNKSMIKLATVKSFQTWCF